MTPREQLNENTAYIDGSMIYSSSPKDADKFRDGRTGFLKMEQFQNQVSLSSGRRMAQMVLPFDHVKCPDRETCSTKNAMFQAGDIRSNLFIGLTALHILFAREHNRFENSFYFLLLLKRPS